MPKSIFGNMNHNRRFYFSGVAASLGLALALSSCGQHVAFTHAPPRTAVQVALAKKAEAVPTPVPIAAVNPAMPTRDNVTESIADHYTMGNLMMQQEKYADAIKEYETAVKLDPTFYDAWNHLAICYQNTGQSKKALEAFKKYKSITQQAVVGAQ